MRPNSYEGMEVKGVLKRMKDKTFAANVSRDDIRDAETPFRQPVVVHIGDRLRDESRFGQQFPESIGKSRKVMSGNCRAYSRINTNKQNAKFRPDAVAQAEVGPVLNHRQSHQQ